MNQSRVWAPIPVLVVSVALLAGLVWGNYRFALSKVVSGGFTIQWTSIRALARTGTSPYVEGNSAEIQAAGLSEATFTGGSHPEYTSPLYSGLVIFPLTLTSDETLAHAFWMTIQFILILGIILITSRLASWKSAWYSFLLFSLFTVFAYHIALPWIDGGLGIWSAFFLLVALTSINASRYEVGGVFLALATIQPQMIILPLIFVLVWAISKRRSLLILWFFITLVLLTVIGLFLVPDWIIQYVRLLYNFSGNFPPGSPGVFFSNLLPGLGKQLGWLVSGVCALILLIEWFLALRKDYRWFLWTVCLTMVLSMWIGIPAIPGNLVGLIIPLILVSALLTERWPRGGPWVAALMTIVLFGWEWALVYLDLIKPQPNQMLNLIFPLPAVLIIGLYWVRWWAVKPKRLLIEELRLGETH